MVQGDAICHGPPHPVHSFVPTPHRHRKGAPTSIDLPVSPIKKTWKSYFKNPMSPRSSVDVEVQNHDHGFIAKNQIEPPSRGRTNQHVEHSHNWLVGGSAYPVSAAPHRPSFFEDPDISYISQLYSKESYDVDHITNKSNSNLNGSGFVQQANNLDAHIVAQINESRAFKQSTSSSSSNSYSQTSTIHTSNSDAVSIASSQTSQSTHSKRSRGQDEDDRNMSVPHDRKGKRIRETSPIRFQDPIKLFACPFAKYDPRRYSHKNMSEPQYRNCCSGNWPDIPRLKQHLYRAHGRSEIYCRRCWQNFERTDTRDKHEREQKCTYREFPEERMTEQQQDIIRSRRQGIAHDLWNEIYRTLFPGLPLPASPYAELVVGEDLRACFNHMEQVLPQLLIEKLKIDLRSVGHENEAFTGLIGQLISNAIPQVVNSAREQFAKDNQITHILPLDSSKVNMEHQESIGSTLEESTSVSSTSSLPAGFKVSHGQSEQDEPGVRRS